VRKCIQCRDHAAFDGESNKPADGLCMLCREIPVVEIPTDRRIPHLVCVRLVEQAFAVVSFVEETFGPRDELADAGLGGDDDDRDLLERVADHVASLNGYEDTDRSSVSDMIWRGLRDRLGVKSPSVVSLTE
jgi:hypothetical protein